MAAKRTKAEQAAWDKAFQDLVRAVETLGYPREFGVLVARELGTVSTMERMTGYLYRLRPASAEEIADEMLSIRADRDKWVEKKQNEFYNQKDNEWLYSDERDALQMEEEMEEDEKE